MLASKSYSLLIPTFNRPAFLGALLEYFAYKKVQFPIVILDSSSDENKAKNKIIVKNHELEIRHLEFNEDARFDFKIASGLREIDSDYTSLCADDDIVFVDAIEACVDELDRDPALAACHGIYLSFAVDRAAVNLRVEYASPSIDMDDVIDRACQLLMRYEAINYAVYRRRVMAEMIDAGLHTPQTLFWELFSGLAPLADGKVKRLDRVYHGRRWNGATGLKTFDPVGWIAEDPDAFGEAFLEYRKHVFNYYGARGVNVGRDARNALTQAHVIYLCHELGDGAGIKRALAGTSSPLARIDLAASKVPFVQLLAPEAWLGSRIRKLPFLAQGAWLGSKIRKTMGPADAVDFTVGEITFRSPQRVRAMLADETISDLSHYIRASANA